VLGEPRRAVALPVTAQLDDVTAAPGGGFWVTDARGAIWRVDAAMQPRRWSSDPLLAPPANAPFPVGANGLAYRRGYLYVSNTFGRQILRLPVRADGSAGAAEGVGRRPAGDGIAFDNRGDLYVTTGQDGTLVRISFDRTVQTIATGADGLDFPAAVAFVRRGTRAASSRTSPTSPSVPPATRSAWIQRVRVEAGR
jgi:sugar lactone lactonase YvrE